MEITKDSLKGYGLKVFLFVSSVSFSFRAYRRKICGLVPLKHIVCVIFANWNCFWTFQNHRLTMRRSVSSLSPADKRDVNFCWCHLMAFKVPDVSPLRSSKLTDLRRVYFNDGQSECGINLHSLSEKRNGSVSGKLIKNFFCAISRPWWCVWYHSSHKLFSRCDMWMEYRDIFQAAHRTMVQDVNGHSF